MGFFKKIKKGFKKVRKALGIPAVTLGNVAKVAGAAAIGGPVGLGAAVLKSKLKSAAVGGIKQVLRTKGQKLLAEKMGQLAPSGAAGAATTMPGGAPLEGRIHRVARGVAAARRVRKLVRGKGPISLNGAPRAKRRPPPGGKNFKALSASWRAAGKPGRWIDWVKSH